MTFTNFSFDKRIDACVKACGYETPTPIQQQAIPLILKGHDVMGLAQTGTGKTAAFALPILQHILTAETRHKAPTVLVLAPTRELAMQINENFNALSRNTGIRSTVVMGGVNMGPQIRAFSSSRIIVACPGRLVRLMAQNAANLSAIDTLVLDEADRMLDMGFMPDIKRILAKLPAKRQNLLFSATMPGSIRSFAEGILQNPKTVRINPAAPVSSIEHTFYKTQQAEKNTVLEDLIQRTQHQSMLIFTRTKHKAKNLALKLSRNGHNSTFLQGNMSQAQRERALKGFCNGQYSIMVATDIAARGIDCDRITHVINYDMPDTVETYTHRIGRTGRAGRSGQAISLVTQDDADQLRAIQRAMRITPTPKPVRTSNTRGEEADERRSTARPKAARKPSNSRRGKPGQSPRAA
ncbi:DEAD/DEAH box helicase [Pseudodesulfovibrio sp.]|uniref:DEAD/DEAH box helicase n=1 Tax=unclassified Pseudodesulfovibrio TaxID=2661612 RepID=UPI003B00588E